MSNRAKKQLILHIPYVIMGLIATNLGEAWRLAEGTNASEKILSLMTTIQTAFTNPLPSFHPLDLLIGVGCAVIFANFMGDTINVVIPIMFAVSVLCLQYAHILFCAAQDLMNPQNEAYATTGSDFNNPNETRATISAFIASAIITLGFYFMLGESMNLYNNYISAFVRLLLISVALFAGFLYLFIRKIQAFYFEK